MGCKGYTLLELSVAITIVVFLAGLTIGSLSSLDRVQVRLAAEQLVADIGLLQQRAVITGKQHTLDLSRYHLPKTVHIVLTKCTFTQQKITAAATGVLCAGTVYLTDTYQQMLYAVTIPVGGAAVNLVQK